MNLVSDKYVRNNHFLSSSKTLRVSYIWKGVLATKDDLL